MMQSTTPIDCNISISSIQLLSSSYMFMKKITLIVIPKLPTDPPALSEQNSYRPSQTGQSSPKLTRIKSGIMTVYICFGILRFPPYDPARHAGEILSNRPNETWSSRRKSQHQAYIFPFSCKVRN